MRISLTQSAPTSMLHTTEPSPSQLALLQPGLLHQALHLHLHQLHLHAQSLRPQLTGLSQQVAGLLLRMLQTPLLQSNTGATTLRLSRSLAAVWSLLLVPSLLFSCKRVAWYLGDSRDFVGSNGHGLEMTGRQRIELRFRKNFYDVGRCMIKNRLLCLDACNVYRIIFKQ